MIKILPVNAEYCDDNYSANIIWSQNNQLRNNFKHINEIIAAQQHDHHHQRQEA